MLVVLDSLHTCEHIAAELEAYAPLVSPSSYLVVFDGVMSVVADAPNAGVDWETNNPLVAVDEFLEANDAFVRDPIYGRLGVTYCPAGFLLRREESGPRATGGVLRAAPARAPASRPSQE